MVGVGFYACVPSTTDRDCNEQADERDGAQETGGEWDAEHDDADDDSSEDTVGFGWRFSSEPWVLLPTREWPSFFTAESEGIAEGLPCAGGSNPLAAHHTPHHQFVVVPGGVEGRCVREEDGRVTAGRVAGVLRLDVVVHRITGTVCICPHDDRAGCKR
jgi:hypothetical protein